MALIQLVAPVVQPYRRVAFPVQSFEQSRELGVRGLSRRDGGAISARRTS